MKIASQRTQIVEEGFASRQRGADQSVVRVGPLQDGVEEESQDVHRDQVS